MAALTKKAIDRAVTVSMVLNLIARRTEDASAFTFRDWTRAEWR
jgi:hypothetical protein